MGLINWQQSAHRLYDFVRGQTHPYPGAFTYHKMDKVTVWHADIYHPTRMDGRVGEVLASLTTDTYLIQTGEGILRAEVANEQQNYPINVGSILGNAP
jgi:methionyl-tRNA formyltransferase